MILLSLFPVLIVSLTEPLAVDFVPEEHSGRLGNGRTILEGCFHEVVDGNVFHVPQKVVNPRIIHRSNLSQVRIQENRIGGKECLGSGLTSCSIGHNLA